MSRKKQKGSKEENKNFKMHYAGLENEFGKWYAAFFKSQSLPTMKEIIDEEN